MTFILEHVHMYVLLCAWCAASQGLSSVCLYVIFFPISFSELKQRFGGCGSSMCVCVCGQIFTLHFESE
jgi:hypothetical protein